MPFSEYLFGQLVMLSFSVSFTVKFFFFFLRNYINNFRYADDTTLKAESEEKLKIKVKEKSEKAGLKLNVQKTEIIASGPITSWQIDGGKMETVTDFNFLGSKITVDGDCSHEIKRCLLLGKKSCDKPRQCIRKAEISLC